VRAGPVGAANGGGDAGGTMGRECTAPFGGLRAQGQAAGR